MRYLAVVDDGNKEYLGDFIKKDNLSPLQNFAQRVLLKLRLDIVN